MLNKIRLIVIVGSVMHCLCCSSQNEIRRELSPGSELVSRKSDGSFYVYSDCNIFVKEMTTADWSRLLQHPFYTNPAAGSDYRIPKLLFFHVIMENREKMPVIPGDIIIEYNGKKHLALTKTELEYLTKNPMYRKINFVELLSPRRFFENEEENYMLEKINYGNTVKFLFDYLPSYEKVVRVIAFKWVPVSVREFSLKFQLKYPRRKKVIDFVFKRFEYRMKDEHFKKKKTLFEKDDYL